MQIDTFRAMNTQILLASEAEDAREGFDLAQSFIRNCELRFTRFSSTSELSILNQHAGEWFRVSPDMFTLLQIARDCTRSTQGLFDPAILPDLESAGYDRSMDEIRSSTTPIKSSLNRKRQYPHFDAVEFQPENQAVKLPNGMRVDLGGIAKGWIAEQAALLLARFSKVCGVNAGGDMFLVGTPTGSAHWEVELEDPRDPEKILMNLMVEPGALATSSVAKRTWEQDGVHRHHIIDPRSGEPATSVWLSVTAFAPSGAEAEVFAKAFLIGGPGFSEELLRINPKIYFLAVNTSGQVYSSKPARD